MDHQPPNALNPLLDIPPEDRKYVQSIEEPWKFVRNDQDINEILKDSEDKIRQIWQNPVNWKRPTDIAINHHFQKFGQFEYPPDGMRCPDELKHLNFYNKNTRKFVPIPCNRYKCPVCGQFKLRRLYSAMLKYFQQFKFVRMFTFTFTTSGGYSVEDHFKIMQKAWHATWREIRRTHILSRRQNNVQFVRCLDLHKSGYVHYHVMVTEFLPVLDIARIWNYNLQRFSGMLGHVGSVHAMGILSHKTATRYVCKYVLKCAEQLSGKTHRFSKSGRVRLFDIRVSNHEWIVVDMRKFLEYQIFPVPKEPGTLLVTEGISAQLIELFETPF